MAIASVVPQVVPMRLTTPSVTSGGRPNSLSGPLSDDPVAFTSTSAETRSGYVAAKTAAIIAPSFAPMSAARSEPVSSITTRTSSIHSSIGGIWSSGTGSESPMPCLSNEIRRVNAARRRR